ncbi:type II toxin-antitoxin system PemK/MazF family toxin [Candidatus Poriferisocius sp.]|uniref:type II toxin-antitoxin system PemK/MazF family toxin n=1 Tax=Candidatus Poriferisocius sp. TaxID=3101276 RepID=UPI003B02E673
MASIDELWLVDFGKPYAGEPATKRPALVLGPPEFFGASFPVAFVVPLTTTFRELSLHVEVPATAQTGLRHTSYIQCELLRSISKQRLLHRLGTVDSNTSSEVSSIVRTLLNH